MVLQLAWDTIASIRSFTVLSERIILCQMSFVTKYHAKLGASRKYCDEVTSHTNYNRNNTLMVTQCEL